MKRFGFLSRLSADPVRTAVCLYALSILWWFLFPLLSISTGELKARGLYVDENALLVNSGSVDFRAGIDSDGNDLGIEGFNLISETVSQQHLTQDSLCSHLRNQFTSLTCVNSEEKYERRRITQIVVDHPWKPKSLEVSVVVIAYHSSNVLQSFAFTTALVSNLVSSDWLAKTVTILLVPVSCSEGELSEGDICTNTAISHQADEDILQVRPTIRYSRLISPWLDRYHSSPRNTWTGNGNGPFIPSEPVAGALHGGLLRDAYIIDFSEPFITSQLLNQSVGNGAKSDNSKRMHWDKIQLLVSGNNGQLPNMDFLSAPLASFPHITVSEADDLSQSRSAGKHREAEGESESIEGEGPVTVGLTDLCSWSGLFSEAKCNHYFTTLFGLIRFTSSMVEGPSGLHGQFIRRNVDAMTIRPHRKISTAAEAKRSRGGRKSNRVQSEASVTNSDKNSNIDTWATGDLSRLVDMVGYFLHISSNLHGTFRTELLIPYRSACPLHNIIAS